MEIKTKDGLDITDAVGIDPITGEFDINLVPESMRKDVERISQFMTENSLIKLKEENRLIKIAEKRKLAKLKRKKTPKTFGKNKKKK